jgi:C-terminal processing protease CtpA/Prc
MIRSFLFSLVATAALAFPALAHADSQPGTFGFSVDVAVEGSFFSPILKTVTIKSVVPGRPAALSGILPDEQIVEVDGTVVAGSKAREIQSLIKRNVGESLLLRLRKPNGESHAVTLVAAAKSD